MPLSGAMYKSALKILSVHVYGLHLCKKLNKKSLSGYKCYLYFTMRASLSVFILKKPLLLLHMMESIQTYILIGDQIGDIHFVVVGGDFS